MPEKPYRPGTCYYPGGFDSTRIPEMPKAVRVFCMTHQHNEQEFRWIGDRVRLMQANNKKVMGTYTVSDPASWNDMPLNEWRAMLTDYIKNVPVKVVEVGNEPGVKALPGYWPKLKAATEMFHAAGIRVISGAPYPTATGEYLIQIQEQGLLDVVDGVAIHPYARDPAGMLDKTWQVRDTLNRAGYNRMPLHLTEFGWATAGPPHPFLVTEAQQAVYLRRAFSALRANSVALRLGFCLWYIWQDWPGMKDSWVYWCGVLRPDGSAKAALRELQLA